MQFNPLSIVKGVVSGAVGIGTTTIVGQIVKAHVTPKNLYERATTVAAAWAIGGVIASHAKNYTDEIIDGGYDAGKKLVNKFKLSAALGRINRNESTFEKEGLDPTKFRRNAKNNEWEPIPTEDDEDPAKDNHKTDVDTKSAS